MSFYAFDLFLHENSLLLFFSFYFAIFNTPCTILQKFQFWHISPIFHVESLIDKKKKTKKKVYSVTRQKFLKGSNEISKKKKKYITFEIQLWCIINVIIAISARHQRRVKPPPVGKRQILRLAAMDILVGGLITWRRELQ